LPISLPIDPLLPDIRASLAREPNLILRASPGSGKTTRVPPALLEVEKKEIWVLEPRRLAAKLAAERVAEERGERVGQTIGYHFRFERETSPATRVLFLTEGMLMRRLLHSPRLDTVGTVILDEFHERSLHADAALGYLRRLQRQRPELRIVVMSATLETERLSEYLGACKTIDIEAPRFPLDITYLEKPASDPLDKLVERAVRRALDEPTTKDILVFLPGIADIRRSESALLRLAQSHSLIIAPLHGELDRREQDLAVRPSAKRKVILATNVAETSLTIEGVNVVIDSGLHRSASYSFWSGVPSLKTRATSKASAIQRAGRAGRTGPGRCYRLYTKSEFEGRGAFDSPEIQRADLAQLLLELKTLGVTDLNSFPWFEPPSPASLSSSEQLLHRLGAIDPAGELTPRGKRMAQIPGHPRLARLLLEAETRAIVEPGASLCALISEGLLNRMDALDQVGVRLDGPAERARRQFLSAVNNDTKAPGDFKEALAKTVLTAFPDRVAKRRSAARGKWGETELILCTGGSAKVEEKGVVIDSDLFVVLDIQEQQHATQLKSQLRVRSLVPIHEDWLLELDPCPLIEKDLFTWNAERKRVQASSRLMYEDLVLTESSVDPKPSRETLRVLLKEGLNVDLEKLLAAGPAEIVSLLAGIFNTEVTENYIARLRLLETHKSNLPVPDWDEWKQSLVAHLTPALSLGQLKEIDFGDFSASLLAPETAAAMPRLLPSHFTLPNGKRAPIFYSLDKEPHVESRLQDFFGVKRPPQLLDGRLPLTLHLLAPNGRPLQITKDLDGFWEREYPRIRKELGRRYPRHPWPEDPHTPVPPKPARR
jgi:ATP-dependent helicase HrpB